MKLTPEQIDILFDATEDCTPLWEAKWEYSKPSEDGLDSVLITQAMMGIDEMLALGLISLSQCSSWVGGIYATVTLAEARGLIQNVFYWHPPMEKDAPWLCFSATDGGKAVLSQDEQVKAYYKSDKFLKRYPDPEWHPMKRT